MKPVRSRETYEARNAELERCSRIYGYVVVVLCVIGTLAGISGVFR